jgi:magnesium chelatase family protein
MVQRVSTVAFEGIEARSVDVQVQVAPGLPAFAIVFTINPHYDSRSAFPKKRPSLEAPSLLIPPNVDRPSAEGRQPSPAA